MKLQQGAFGCRTNSDFGAVESFNQGCILGNYDLFLICGFLRFFINFEAGIGGIVSYEGGGVFQLQSQFFFAVGVAIVEGDEVVTVAIAASIDESFTLASGGVEEPTNEDFVAGTRVHLQAANSLREKWHFFVQITTVLVNRLLKDLKGFFRAVVSNSLLEATMEVGQLVTFVAIISRN